jgi:4-alpha-glucanotransferase
MSESHHALHELSDEVGILPSYLDQTGQHTRHTSDETRRAFLTAMGFDVSTDEATRDSLDRLRAEQRATTIERTRVVPFGDPRARRLCVNAPSDRAHSGPWSLEIELENGDRIVTEGPWRGGTELDLDLPELPLGYHELRLTMSAGASEWRNEQTLIIVPQSCVTPDEVLAGRSAFGLVANLYTVRSRNNWGIGDFSDLAALAEWGGSVGAEFVGVNPLHALLNRGFDISPYSPLSRLYRNPIYIDVACVPELQRAPEIATRIASPEFVAELESLRESSGVQYEQVTAVKGLVLKALHHVFETRVRGSGEPRDREFKNFIRTNDPGLTRFATWMTIAEHQHNTDWHSWPAELRDASSDAVDRFTREHASRVDYHRWLQFEADRQLRTASDRARDAGMRIGLYQDLAIGTSPCGADTWAFPELFVPSVSVGAPPDPYAAQGQNWGLPPLDPRALRRTCYRYYIDLLRSGFRNGGALRIDHVLGLFRLFWIPEGKSGADGAYVRYPTDDLFGILALESVRHNAIVVGEDLGTVPPEVPPTLAKWGVLSSKVLQFERDWHGFKSLRSYPKLALATADTHDMAPIAGFWEERDIDIREQVGLLDENAARDARVERQNDREALVRRLAEEHVITEAREPHSPAALRGAIHGFMCRTPSQLVGLALDDLAGEREPVNVPGVGNDRFPSWTRKMRDTLETIFVSEDTHAALRCDGRRPVDVEHLNEEQQGDLDRDVTSARSQEG